MGSAAACAVSAAPPRSAVKTRLTHGCVTASLALTGVPLLLDLGAAERVVTRGARRAPDVLHGRRGRLRVAGAGGRRELGRLGVQRLRVAVELGLLLPDLRLRARGLRVDGARREEAREVLR